MKVFLAFYITEDTKLCTRQSRHWTEKSIQHNKLIQIEISMLMYGIYNAETLEHLINTIHSIHNTISSHEILLAGQQNSLTLSLLYVNTKGIHHYSINSLLYLRTVQDKYVSLYKEFITQLGIYETAIRVLAKFHSLLL